MQFIQLICAIKSNLQTPPNLLFLTCLTNCLIEITIFMDTILRTLLLENGLVHLPNLVINIL